jgi:uncharacterized membrane protein
MLLLVSFLVALGLAFVTITAMTTAWNYEDLPDRIPVRFGFSPEPVRYGPKPMAWMLPIVQTLAFLISGVAAYQNPLSINGLLSVVAIVDSVVLTLFAAQWLIIETAKNGPSAKRYRTFWLVFALTMIVVPVSAIFAK